MGTEHPSGVGTTPPGPKDRIKRKGPVAPELPGDPGKGGMGFGGQRGFAEGTVRTWNVGGQQVQMRKVAGKWVPARKAIRSRVNPEDPTGKRTLVTSPVHYGGIHNIRDMVVGAEYAIPLKDDDGNEFRAFAKIVGADEEVLTLQVEDHEGNPIPHLSNMKMTRQALAAKMLDLHKEEYRKRAKRLRQEAEDVKEFGTAEMKKERLREVEDAGLTTLRVKAPFDYDATMPPNFYGLNRSALRITMERSPEDPDKKIATLDTAIGDLVENGFYQALTGPGGDGSLLDHLAANQGVEKHEMEPKDIALAGMAELALARWWQGLDDASRDLFAANYCDHDAQRYGEETAETQGKGKKRRVSGLDDPIHHDEDVKIPRGMQKMTERGWKPHRYQFAAAAFAVRHATNKQAIFAMEMGLGKTLAAILAFHMAKEQTKTADQALITCPLSAVESWRKDFGNCSNQRVAILTDHDRKGRAQLFREYEEGKWDVLVMTPETMVMHKNDIRRVMAKNARRIMRIGDEAHLYKTKTARRTKLWRKLMGGDRPGHVIGMTGTLKPNMAKDIYHVIENVAPGAVGLNEDIFHERYCQRVQDPIAGKNYIAFQPDAMKKMRRDMGGHIFARTTEDEDAKWADHEHTKPNFKPIARHDLAPRLKADYHQDLTQRLLIHCHKLKVIASGGSPQTEKKAPKDTGPRPVKRKLKMKKVRADATSQLGGSEQFAGSLGQIMEEHGGAASQQKKEMSPENQKRAEAAKAELTAIANGERGGKMSQLYAAIAEIAPTSPLTLIQRLHMASIDPRLLSDKVHAAMPKGYVSNKLNFCADVAVRHLQNNPSKGAVIFGNYTKSLEHMKSALVAKGVKEKHIAVIDGSTPPHRRRMIQLMLNQHPDEKKDNPELYARAMKEIGPIKYLIAQTKSMMTGANLQKRANMVIHMDTPHEPDALTQSTARVVRQGQQDTTFVVRPTSSDVEHMISTNVHRKIVESNKAMGMEMKADFHIRDSIERAMRGEYNADHIATTLGLPKGTFDHYLGEDESSEKDFSDYVKSIGDAMPSMDTVEAVQRRQTAKSPDGQQAPMSTKQMFEEMERLRAEHAANLAKLRAYEQQQQGA